MFIKNHTCYYFDYIINVNDIDLDNILIDKKSYENILIYDVAYKTPYGAKPLHKKYDKTMIKSMIKNMIKQDI